MLNETAPPVIGQPVLDELARHLKLPEPHDDSAMQEAEAALRASIAYLEAQLGLALIQRSFVWRRAFRSGRTERTPMAPVVEITAIERFPDEDASSALDPGDVTLDHTELRAKMSLRRSVSGAVEITFIAGFGETWDQTPTDLRQAAFMLAAHYFDARHATGDTGGETLLGVAALIAPWRPLRLSLRNAE